MPLGISHPSDPSHQQFSSSVPLSLLPFSFVPYFAEDVRLYAHLQK